MARGRLSWVVAILAVFGLALVAGFGRTPAAPGGALAPVGGGATTAEFIPGVANVTRVGDSFVGAPVAAYSSRPLSDLPKAQGTDNALKFQTERDHGQVPMKNHVDQPDTVVQRTFGLPGSGIVPQMPSPNISWEGMNLNNASGIPPDTTGAVGPTQYVQMVNSAIAVWDKSGNLLAGPVNINQLWNGQNNLCSNTNPGDPIVLYDHMANRWLVSQFAFTSSSTGPFAECIAISQTSSAAGAYNAYTFILDNNYFEDYPHFGIWPDGYYMAMNEFDSSGSQRGPRMFVFNRAAMLTGGSASFQSSLVMPGEGLFMPSDLDGATQPPAGAPNYVLGGISSMKVWKYHVDWNTPANSSFTQAANLPVAGFTRLCQGVQACLPQPGTSRRVDGLGDRLMFRAAYRNLNGVERVVVNNSVDAGGGTAGVRWYEVRGLSGTPTLYQQGTYAPDSNNRWAGSVAQDKFGNTAMGFNVVSASTYPSIRYTGRLDSDPLGTMPQGEAVLVNGTGSQVADGSNGPLYRWGDYSALTVDPADDCTFWYTTEYFATTGYIWQTRIGSFSFPACGGAPQATPTATATAAATVTPDPNCIFSDVCPSDYFYGPVGYLVQHGAIGGYTDGTFRPYNNTTRGQLAKIVVLAEAFPISTPSGGDYTFADNPPGSTFFDYVETASAYGLVSGYSCGGVNPQTGASEFCDGASRPYYRVGNNVTRGQLSKIIVNAQLWTIDTTGGPHFNDVTVGSTFYTYVETAVNHGIITGYNDGSFRPNNPATRGQISKIVYLAVTNP